MAGLMCDEARNVGGEGASRARRDRGSLFDQLGGNGARAQLRKAGINCFAGRLFTAAATAGDRQMLLDLAQRPRSPVYEVANLPIRDRVTDANVHGATQDS